MIATGGELAELDRAHTMGLEAEGQLDIDALGSGVVDRGQAPPDRSTTARVARGVRSIRGTAG